MNSDKHHIFIIDDDQNVCNMICKDLEQYGINATCFTNGEDCFRELESKRCDLLITDLNMPGINGIELMKKVKCLIPYLPIIIITGHGDIPTAVSAIKYGAEGFYAKPLEIEKFIQKIRSVLHQNHDIHRIINKPLTDMEMKVLKLIIDGNSNLEIATILNRSIRTVEVHRAKIMKKLEVDNVIDLIKRTTLLGHIELNNNIHNKNT